MTVDFRIPEIETERLCLRAPQASDFDAFAEFRGSERAAYVGGPNTRIESWHQLCALAGQWALRGYGRWIIADKSTDEPLGTTGIYHPEGWPAPEIAWSVFARGEGRGIAFEAAKAARQYVYETLGWPSVISVVSPENERSLALAKRLGCTPERQFRHAVFGVMDIWRHPGPEALA